MNAVRALLARIIPRRWRLLVHQRISRVRGRQAVHIFHIGKTGGTAVRTALLRHRHPGRYNLHLQFHDTTLSDIPRGDLVVFFLRDPVSRFASAFDNQRRGGAPLYTHTWTKAETIAFERFETDAALALALGSPDLETRRAAEAAMRGIGHVQNFYWDWFGDEAYFRERLDDIFFVGFQETLSEDFEELKRRLGVPPAVSLPADDYQSQRRPTKPDPLPAEAVALLREWYAADYDFIRLCEETVLDRPAPIELERRDMRTNR